MIKSYNYNVIISNNNILIKISNLNISKIIIKINQNTIYKKNKF